MGVKMNRSLSAVAAAVLLFSALSINAQAKIKADTVVDTAESKVSYDIKTSEGEDLVLTADYVSGKPDPELENMDIAPKDPIDEGTKVFKIMSKEGAPIEIQYSYRGGERAGMKIFTEPTNPSSDTEYYQVLSVESKGGYIIHFTFIWQGKDLKEVRIEPLVNPFAVME